MANKLITSSLLILSFLVATASLSNAQTNVTISATNLTCSVISPFPNQQILVGANVSLSSDGGLTAISSTTTDSTGSFTLILPNVISVPKIFPLVCRVYLVLPANCTIPKLNARVTTLVSLGISAVPFVPGSFRVKVFVAL